MTRILSLALALGLTFGLAGCCQGPGYTRAAGTVGGTAAGALIGAAASPCCPGGGALIGGLTGLVVGSMAGDAIATQQECCGQGCGCCQQAPCGQPCCAPPPQGCYYYAPPPPGYYSYGPPPPGYYYGPPR